MTQVLGVLLGSTVLALSICGTALAQNSTSDQKSVAEMKNELAALPDPLSPDFPHQMCVYQKAANMDDCVARVQKIQQETTQGIPMYDTSAYCEHIGDVAGGSDEIELTCRQEEADAHEWARQNVGPTRSMNYCAKIGSTAGGSYEIFKSCLQEEESASSQLGKTQ